MNKAIPIGIGIAAAISIFVVFFGFASEPAPPITQQDLRQMIDEWMQNPDENDREQRLEIMKAYYTFEESGQQLSDDQEGRVMLNQIRKMVSLDIPKAELDQMKEEIRADLKKQGFEITE